MGQDIEALAKKLRERAFKPMTDRTGHLMCEAADALEALRSPEPREGWRPVPVAWRWTERAAAWIYTEVRPTWLEGQPSFRVEPLFAAHAPSDLEVYK